MVKAIIAEDATIPFKSTREADTVMPLALAVSCGHTNIVSYLIGLGVDLEARDPEGDTALITSITLQAHDCLKLLLEHGANYLTISDESLTLLHHVARFADATTMNTLSRHKMPGLDVSARNTAGLTPRQVFARRLDRTPVLEQAFESFFESIVRVNQNWEEEDGCDVESQDETFVDALEELQL
jgi:ankyrin repeat protein